MLLLENRFNVKIERQLDCLACGASRSDDNDATSRRLSCNKSSMVGREILVSNCSHLQIKVQELGLLGYHDCGLRTNPHEEVGLQIMRPQDKTTSRVQTGRTGKP